MTVERRIELANGSIVEFRSNVGATPIATVDGKEVPHLTVMHLVFPEVYKEAVDVGQV